MIEITQERIRELSAEACSNAETKANDKDDTRWWHPDHYDQEFARLTIPEVCPVLNIPINKTWGYADQDENKDSCPSIDRVIPSLGYVKHNIRIISGRANRIKTDSTVEEIKLVYEYTMRESKKSWLDHCLSS